MLGCATQQPMRAMGPSAHIQFSLLLLQHAVAHFYQRLFIALLPSGCQGKAGMEFSVLDARTVLPSRMLALVQRRVLEPVWRLISRCRLVHQVRDCLFVLLGAQCAVPCAAHSSPPLSRVATFAVMAAAAQAQRGIALPFQLLLLAPGQGTKTTGWYPPPPPPTEK
eukprot:6465543-Amphidinium_carterae.2